VSNISVTSYFSGLTEPLYNHVYVKIGCRMVIVSRHALTPASIHNHGKNGA